MYIAISMHLKIIGYEMGFRNHHEDERSKLIDEHSKFWNIFCRF